MPKRDEGELALVEAPLFAVGWARHELETVRRRLRIDGDELARADAALAEAQRQVAAWSDYPYGRREK